MKRIFLETACQSVADVRAAMRAGADSVELSAALATGGWTPSAAMIEQARAASTTCILAVLVRPRGGDFHYGTDEVAVMERDIEIAIAAGADAIVTGALTFGPAIDTETMARLVDRAAPVPVVFHRAFDLLTDPQAALDDLIRLGIRSVLTSGAAPTAQAGAQNLAALYQAAAGRIEIIGGGGIRADHVGALLAQTGLSRIHAGPRRSRMDPNAQRRGLDFGSADALDEAEIAALVAACNSISADVSQIRMEPQR